MHYRAVVNIELIQNPCWTSNPPFSVVKSKNLRRQYVENESSYYWTRIKNYRLLTIICCGHQYRLITRKNRNGHQMGHIVSSATEAISLVSLSLRVESLLDLITPSLPKYMVTIKTRLYVQTWNEQLWLTAVWPCVKTTSATFQLTNLSHAHRPRPTYFNAANSWRL